MNKWLYLLVLNKIKQRGMINTKNSILNVPIMHKEITVKTVYILLSDFRHFKKKKRVKKTKNNAGVSLKADLLRRICKG